MNFTDITLELNHSTLSKLVEYFKDFSSISFNFEHDDVDFILVATAGNLTMIINLSEK